MKTKLTDRDRLNAEILGITIDEYTKRKEREAKDFNKYEAMRLRYESLSNEKQLQLQEYYDQNLSQGWEEKVIEEGACHYDDVDSMGEIAWEWYLEH